MSGSLPKRRYDDSVTLIADRSIKDGESNLMGKFDKIVDGDFVVGRKDFAVLICLSVVFPLVVLFIDLILTGRAGYISYGQTEGQTVVGYFVEGVLFYMALAMPSTYVLFVRCRLSFRRVGFVKIGTTDLIGAIVAGSVSALLFKAAWWAVCLVYCPTDAGEYETYLSGIYSLPYGEVSVIIVDFIVSPLVTTYVLFAAIGGYLESRYGVIVSLVMCCGAFGAMGGSLTEAIAMFFFASVIFLLFHRTKSILATSIAYSVGDAILFLFL